jgi:hypothetical protein
MKIGTYHRLLGDDVKYVIGKNSQARDDWWDKIYITSVFTYDFTTLVDTVKYYRANLANIDNVQVGGISASLLHNKLYQETGIRPTIGLLDSADRMLESISHDNPEFKYLIDCGASIDNLPPAYDIFGDGYPRYSKILDNSYLMFTTKGCPNNCSFCAVKTLEPNYKDYLPLVPRINYIAKRWGEKPGLLLLDNNIAASNSYDRILDEIYDCGFEKGAKIAITKDGRKYYKQRFVDFNQGVDLRKMDRHKMEKMARIAIKPLRLAFDSFDLASEYEEKARLAIDCGIESLSNYMLYNYKDSPDELYLRFETNMTILSGNQHVKIFSFPMRYSPVTKIHRKYIGDLWTRREVRAVQIILNATHGIVSHNKKFFHHAFGHDVNHFRRILLYPYSYIINRVFYENAPGYIDAWELAYAKLSANEAAEFKSLIADGPLAVIKRNANSKINELLRHYEGENSKVLLKSVSEQSNEFQTCR